jgi:hypothetical protein
MKNMEHYYAAYVTCSHQSKILSYYGGIVFSANFKQYFSYIVVVVFFIVGGGKRSIWRKPPL